MLHALSDLLKDLHPVCLLYDVCVHVEGVQCSGGESIPHLHMLQDRTCVLGTWSGV